MHGPGPLCSAIQSQHTSAAVSDPDSMCLPAFTTPAEEDPSLSPPKHLAPTINPCPLVSSNSDIRRIPAVKPICAPHNLIQLDHPSSLPPLHPGRTDPASPVPPELTRSIPDQVLVIPCNLSTVSHPSCSVHTILMRSDHGLTKLEQNLPALVSNAPTKDGHYVHTFPTTLSTDAVTSNNLPFMPRSFILNTL